MVKPGEDITVWLRREAGSEGVNGHKNREQKFLVVAADDDLIYTVFIGLVAFEIL